MKVNPLHTFLGARYSGHGFSRFDNSPEMGGIIRRVCWLLATFALTATGLWQVTLTTMEYMTYPTLSTSESLEPTVLPFPAVHICPTASYNSIELCGRTIRDLQFERDYDDDYYDSDYVANVPDKLGLSLLCMFQDMIDHNGKIDVTLVNGRAVLNETCERIMDDTSRIINESLPLMSDNFEDIVQSFRHAFEIGTDADLHEGLSYEEKQKLIVVDRDSLSDTDYIGHIVTRTKTQFLAYLGQKIHELKDKSPDFLQFASDVRVREPNKMEKCSFVGKPCDMKIAPHPIYKQCFVFNHQYFAEFPDHNDNTDHGHYVSEVVHTTGAGLQVKLTLKRFQREDILLNLLSSANSAKGFRVFVTDTSAAGLTEIGSIVEEGFQYDLHLQRKETNRLDPHGNGKCAPSDDFERLFPEWNILGQYSRSSCVELFILKHALEKCGCRPGSSTAYLIKDFQEALKDFRICDNADLLCEQHGRYESNEKVKKLCAPACSQVTFDTALEKFRSKPNIPQASVESAKRNETFCSDEANRYSVILNIYYSTMEVPVFTESYVYNNFLTFLSNIGGTLGLFFGASIITIAEFVELGFDCLIYPFGKFGRADKKRSTGVQKHRTVAEGLENRTKSGPVPFEFTGSRW